MTSAIDIINVPTTALLAGETKAILSSKKKCRASLFLNRSFLLRINEGLEIVGSFFQVLMRLLLRFSFSCGSLKTNLFCTNGVTKSIKILAPALDDMDGCWLRFLSKE